MEHFITNNNMNYKKFKKSIYLYFNLNDISYGSILDSNEFEIIKVSNADEVVNYLFHNNIGAIDLNFINKNSESDIYQLNLSIWEFNAYHMIWISKNEMAKTKFIEVNNLIN